MSDSQVGTCDRLVEVTTAFGKVVTKESVYRSVVIAARDRHDELVSQFVRYGSAVVERPTMPVLTGRFVSGQQDLSVWDGKALVGDSCLDSLRAYCMRKEAAEAAERYADEIVARDVGGLEDGYRYLAAIVPEARACVRERLGKWPDMLKLLWLPVEWFFDVDRLARIRSKREVGKSTICVDGSGRFLLDVYAACTNDVLPSWLVDNRFFVSVRAGARAYVRPEPVVEIGETIDSVESSPVVVGGRSGCVSEGDCDSERGVGQEVVGHDVITINPCACGVPVSAGVKVGLVSTDADRVRFAPCYVAGVSHHDDMGPNPTVADVRAAVDSGGCRVMTGVSAFWYGNKVHVAVFGGGESMLKVLTRGWLFTAAHELFGVQADVVPMDDRGSGFKLVVRVASDYSGHPVKPGEVVFVDHRTVVQVLGCDGADFSVNSLLLSGFGLLDGSPRREFLELVVLGDMDSEGLPHVELVVLAKGRRAELGAGGIRLSRGMQSVRLADVCDGLDLHEVVLRQVRWSQWKVESRRLEMQVSGALVVGQRLDGYYPLDFGIYMDIATSVDVVSRYAYGNGETGIEGLVKFLSGTLMGIQTEVTEVVLVPREKGKRRRRVSKVVIGTMAT